MIKTALVFPGQGSQSVGMGKDLYNNFIIARQAFEEASDAIHVDLKKLCFEGPADELGKTHNTQPALLTVSIAAYRALQHESGFRADFMAGHSLGEYSALTASGAISFSDAVKLVRFRGKVMSEAAGDGTGMMAAILGLSREAVDEVISEVKGEGVLTAANYNCPGQIVISGSIAPVQKAMEACREKGAKRALPLSVSGPFHTELMSGAARRLQERLGDIDLKEPQCIVYSNVTAKPYGSADDITALLVRQIQSSVMWEDSVSEMIAGGADVFIEVGAGKVLTGLTKRITKETVNLNVNNTDTLKKTISACNEIRSR